MSATVHAPRLRPERLIAAGRVILAVFSLFAVWLDPTEPVKFANVAYGLLVAYVVYASVVAAVVWRVESVSRRWPAVTHAVDLVFFSLFIFFTEGPGSPFTVYFVFALTCGTLRWQARGTVLTAVVTLTVFAAVGIYFGLVLGEPAFDLRAFIIRGVYLFVLAVLLGYVGVHEQRILREMWLLASWPHAVNADVTHQARNLLGYAEPLVGAPHALLAWNEHDTPRRLVASWNRGQWSCERQSVGKDLVASDIADRAFICADLPSGRTLIQREPQSLDLVPWSGEPVEQEFARSMAARSVLSVPVSGESFSGRLFLFDKLDITLDDLMIAEIMAGVMAASLDTCYLNAQLRHAAATEERIRLSRDLHDGVLQSFTGIALRLAAIRTMMVNNEPGLVAAVEHAQRILASEQRDLRFFIQDLKPSARQNEDEALAVRLSELVQRVEREWDLRVDLHVDTPDALPDSLCRNVYHIVREALVNAVRHGVASAAVVTLTASGPSTIALSITDNGRGFSFRGRYSSEDLARLEIGPKTLRERVRAMNGTLTVESGPSGAVLHVVLPSVAA